MTDLLCKLNGTTVPYPIFDNEDISDYISTNSDRSKISGKYIQNVIRKNIKTYSLNWVNISEENGKTILKLLKENDYVLLSFYDVMTGEDNQDKYKINSLKTTDFRMAINKKRYYSIQVELEQI